MSGPSSRSTTFDLPAAARSCSRSSEPAPGMSRSMMNLRNATVTSLGCVLPQSCGGQLAKLRLEGVEIDRLGEELGRTEVIGTAPPLVVAIGGHHHHLQVREALLDLSQ